MGNPQWAVLCDFDGAISKIVTTDLILSKFARGDWVKFQQQLYNGKISLRECVQKQYSLVSANPSEIIAEVGKMVSVRANFGKLVSYCENRNYPFVITSAGLDIIVRDVLRRGGWLDHVKLYMPKSEFTANGVRIEFPTLLDGSSRNLKDDLVVYYKKSGKKVAYIGDGSQDLPAVERADLVFSVKGSKLSRLCDEKELPHQEIDDFEEVVDRLVDISDGSPEDGS